MKGHIQNYNQLAKQYDLKEIYKLKTRMTYNVRKYEIYTIMFSTFKIKNSLY